MRGISKCLLVGALLCFAGGGGCGRTAFVQDYDGVPMGGVKVTLTSGADSVSSFTNKRGVAKLDAELAEKEGTISYEKEGYVAESYRYPGGKSLIESMKAWADVGPADDRDCLPPRPASRSSLEAQQPRL